jgi:hypothetical protein
MPNWCSNVVTINCNGDEELTKRLKESLDSEKDLFNQFVPQPKFENEEDWYWWNVENWGTKWDAKPYSIEWVDNDTVKFNIETAWSPCNKFWEEMENLGYSVTSYYLEEGMAFCGCFEDGNDDYYDYGNTGVYDLPEWAEDVFGIISRHEDEEEERWEEEQRDIEDNYEKTDWYPAKIKPFREGDYQVKYKGMEWVNKVSFTDGKWQNSFHKVAFWRGITEEQYFEIHASDLIEALNEENSING